MNLGFVVTSVGVVVIDTGPSIRVAQALQAAIRTITQQPIAYVINTNSQNHRWLGNAFYKTMGIPIIAHKEAVRLMNEQGDGQMME